MAKRSAITSPPDVPPAVTLKAWGASVTMYRVHDTTYRVDQFNPSSSGNARFSPIREASGTIIPTLYAATTDRGALMESVFRDVPYRTGFKQVDANRLVGMACSTITFQQDFQFLDLSKVALRGLGVHPRQLIDTTKARYPETRRWAEQVYARHTAVQGFMWSSRQDDRALSVVLFGSRVPAHSLTPGVSSLPLIRHGVPEDFVQQLATDLNVLVK